MARVPGFVRRVAGRPAPPPEPPSIADAWEAVVRGVDQVSGVVGRLDGALKAGRVLASDPRAQSTAMLALAARVARGPGGVDRDAFAAMAAAAWDAAGQAPR